jgi:N-acetylmuramoyl-L-alanine amidase
VQIFQDILPPECYAQRELKARYIVLHATAGSTYAGAKAAYISRLVSAHYTVEKSGKIWQNVPLERCAYHAGASTWQGVDWLNWSSVGIEMVNLNKPVNADLTVEPDPYPEAQVKAVTELVLHLAETLEIGWQSILTHAMIAPGRKSDPSGFWQYFEILEAVRAGGQVERPKVLIPNDQGGWQDIGGQRWEGKALVINATDPDRVFIRGR